MKKLIFLFFLGISCYPGKAQTDREKAQLKNIMTQAYESVSQATRQWFNDASEKHPAGDFDSSYAKRKLNEKFSSSQFETTGELFACMMAYQKMMNKEAREDQKTKSHMKRLMLASKAEKLKMQNEAIDAGVQEAREKADRAMDAAVTQLISGIISGNLQIGATASSYSGRTDPAKPDSVKPKSRIIVNSPKLSLPQYLKKLEDQLAIVKKGIW